MKWPWFIGAAVLAGFLLLSAGAPLGPVLAGTMLIAAWNLMRRRRTR